MRSGYAAFSELVSEPRSVQRDHSRQKNVKNPSRPSTPSTRNKTTGNTVLTRERERGVYERVACLTATQSLSGVHRRAELQQRLLEAPRGELRHGALLGELVGVLIRHLLEVVQISGQIM